MTTETTTATTAATAGEKIDQLRRLFADAPEVGKDAGERAQQAGILPSLTALDWFGEEH
jgi:hypothetical protein